MKKRISEGQKLTILSLLGLLLIELILMGEFTGFSVFKVFGSLSHLRVTDSKSNGGDKLIFKPYSL
jgi:hypothetical protein